MNIEDLNVEPPDKCLGLEPDMFVKTIEGNSFAQLDIDKAYFDIPKVTQKHLHAISDFSKTLEWCEQTEGTYKNFALRRLSLLYEHGNGADKNYKKAFEYYMLSQGEGNKDACYNIAMLYYDGKGVVQDFFASFKYFERVLEGNYRESNVYVLVEYDTESSSLTNQRKKRYSYVSEKTIHGEVHFYLGIMNEKGQGTCQDHEKAL